LLLSRWYDGLGAEQCGVLAVIQEYRLTYRVFDDKFENSTTLIIQVLDVNDNAPRFDNAVYNVLDLYEEEPGISKSSPKYLLTVRGSVASPLSFWFTAK